MIKKILRFLGFLFLITGLLLIFNEGIKKHERAECLKWQKQAKEIKGFYWTDWQIKQCKAVLK